MNYLQNHLICKQVCVAVFVVLAVSLHIATGQVNNNNNEIPTKKKTSNYGKQAISITYEGEEGLPQFGTLDGTVTELDSIPSSIMLNKTKADLSCAAGYMDVSLEFQRPFHGIVYANFDRHR